LAASRSRGVELDHQRFEPGHARKASHHHSGWNVGRKYGRKIEVPKVCSRQEQRQGRKRYALELKNAEARGRSTQERIREYRRKWIQRARFEEEFGQRRVWIFHNLPDLFQKLIWNARKIDFTYALVKLEDGKDVFKLHLRQS
jgi:hypothetical protein